MTLAHSHDAGFTPVRRFAERGFTPVRRFAEHGFTPVRRFAEHGFTPVRRFAEHGFTPVRRFAEHGFTPVRRSAEHGFTPVRRFAEHGFTPVRRSAEHGFTLIEVMIALLIFGMIAAAGVALLSFSVRAQGVTAARLDDVSALQRLSSVMAADLAQALDRKTRDEGGALAPAFVGGAGSSVTPMLRVVRGGWSNVDGAPRPNAQKVAYRWTAGAIERVAYPELDGAAPLAPVVLVDRVRQTTLRYRIGGAWSDVWAGTGPAALPQAVELTIVREDGTTLRQVFLVASPAPTPTPTPSPSPTGAS